MNSFLTNHAIFFFSIITLIVSLLLVHNHDFISSSFSKSTKPNTVIPLFLAFISGVLLTLLCTLTIIEFRRIKRVQQSPPPPIVEQRSSAAAGGGISGSQLKSLPIFVYCEENRPKLGKGAGDCAICLTEFSNEQTLRWLPGCDHLFHRGCIDIWFESRKTCPCCRANVENVKLENGQNSMSLLGREGDGEIGEGRRVGCERWAVSGLVRALTGRRPHFSHRHH